MINLAFVMGFIGVATGIIIGILIYSNIDAAIKCPETTASADGAKACASAKSYAWTVIGILPVGLFFALFSMFGGFADYK